MRLVVVSNRVPSVSGDERQTAPVGGLVSALRPALEGDGGLWFGWSGRTTPRRAADQPTLETLGSINLAMLDLSEDDHSLYYNGFSNRTLWPLLHSFPERVIIRRDFYRAYRRVNRRFAEALYPMLQPRDMVWVHDFHLFHLGEELRRMGWMGRTGFFLHVPFPSANIFGMLPWARDILKSLLCYDLLGVHTERYLRDLRDTLLTELGGEVCGDLFVHSTSKLRFGVYPLGIDTGAFRNWSIEGTNQSLPHFVNQPFDYRHKVVLGVDRLDYTKGVPLRIQAFGRLLVNYPSLRGRVSYVQISSPSRTQVPEYIQEKRMVDRLIGEIIGRYSTANWVPIRYLYRSFTQPDLARVYRDAAVCLVTPLRDGMNLVAKEFVASQGEDPGVLVLSKFTGVAESLEEAIVVNPYDVDGTAEGIRRALTMRHSERLQRGEHLFRRVNYHTAQRWRETFQTDLATSPGREAERGISTDPAMPQQASV